MQEEVTEIKPPRLSMDLSTVWRNRELLYFFAWRDVKVKYKQTYLGFAWVLLQPLALMAMFYFIFSRSLKVDTGINYFVFVFSGLLLWELFSSGIRNSADSLVENAAMIRKIYFPRILIPLAALLASLVDFAIAFLLFIILVFLFQSRLEWTALLFFPAGVAVAFLSSFGIGALFGAMNVKYRDFRYVLPFFIQLLFFGSQVVYSVANVTDPLLHDLLYLNPLNGALELFRSPLYSSDPYWAGIGISCMVTAVVLVSGLLYFKKTEAYFADLV